MDLATSMQGRSLIVRVVSERIDAACAIQFKERMRKVVDVPSDRVILDLASVRFMDSSGLGAVVAVMKLIAPQRRLELAGLSASVEKVFRLTRMDSIFTIHASLPSGADGQPHGQ